MRSTRLRSKRTRRMFFHDSKRKTEGSSYSNATGNGRPAFSLNGLDKRERVNEHLGV